MLLADAGEEFEYVSDGMPGVIPADSFACPVLLRGGASLSQTPAILLHLAKQLGYDVAAADQAKAVQTLLDIGDLWSEGYNGRKEADKGAKFLETRLGRWCRVLENTAAARPGPYLFGEAPSFLDFTWLNTHRTFLFMYGPRYAAVVDQYPRLKASADATSARPKVAAFLLSTRPVLYPSVAAVE